MVELEEGLVAEFAFLVFPVICPKLYIHISNTLQTRGGETFKVRLVLDLLQGKWMTLWVTAVLI